MDSSEWISDSTPVNSGMDSSEWIPDSTFGGILDSNVQYSGFHEQKFPGFRNTLDETKEASCLAFYFREN